MFGEFIELKNKLKETAKRKLRIEKLRKELAADINADERIRELLDLEESEKKETKKRFSEINKQIKDYKQMIIEFSETKGAP